MKDVIVVGAGLAGLTCSVKLAEENYRVKLVSPSPSERAQSVMAMGGINAALNTKGQDDSVEEHYHDTINGGQDINNHKAVKKLTKDAPDIVKWLSDIGTSFTRDENGNVDVRYFGGQKKMRTAYAGARTGKQIVTALNSQCRRYEYEGRIERLVGWRFLSVITDEENSQCHGVILVNEIDNSIRSFSSANVVIATGGMNKVFGKTSGSVQNDGCAVGRLFMQNVTLSNLEMIQYHPTTIDTPVKRMLITEAARGEGGRIYTYKDGEKWYFMEEWYPEHGALMPRDIVSQSIHKVCNQLNLGIDNENKVYLDISHLPEETVRVKLDEVYSVCTHYINLDPRLEPIPIYPGVHYFMGGINTDYRHKTNIKGLYAIGECSSLYHGANRLGGNSLLGAIHGGLIASEEIIKGEDAKVEECLVKKALKKEKSKYDAWKKLKKDDQMTSSYVVEEKISEIMNHAMAIYRNEKDLLEAYENLGKLEKSDNINSHGNYYEYIRIESLIALSKAMVKSALERKESRGAHQRIEYPEKNDDYLKITLAEYNDDDIQIRFEDTEIKSWW